jgi:hypothetical protein
VTNLAIDVLMASSVADLDYRAVSVSRRPAAQ